MDFQSIVVDCLCFSSDYHVQAQRAVSAADRQAAEQALQASHEVWLGATADSAARGAGGPPEPDPDPLGRSGARRAGDGDHPEIGRRGQDLYTLDRAALEDRSKRWG